MNIQYINYFIMYIIDVNYITAVNFGKKANKVVLSIILYTYTMYYMN